MGSEPYGDDSHNSGTQNGPYELWLLKIQSNTEHTFLIPLVSHFFKDQDQVSMVLASKMGIKILDL